MIQTLIKTIGAEKDSIIVLDALRKQRNVADYAGDLIPESTAKSCLQQAEKLLIEVEYLLQP